MFYLCVMCLNLCELHIDFNENENMCIAQQGIQAHESSLRITKYFSVEINNSQKQ